MKMYEFGQKNNDAVILLHCSCMTWEMFEAAAEALKQQYHVIIPAMPGYDLENDSDYTSVEEIAEELERWLISRGYMRIRGLYGLSMGGSIAVRLLANGHITFDRAVIDGGITPYTYPWIVTQFIAVRDFLMIELGKHSRRLLEAAYPPEKYTDEGIDYLEKVMHHMSMKTIWNTFYSCNNYSMPPKTGNNNTRIEYWYGEKEKKARKKDIKYIKNIYQQTEFREYAGMEHAELALLCTKIFTERLSDFFGASC